MNFKPSSFKGLVSPNVLTNGLIKGKDCLITIVLEGLIYIQILINPDFAVCLIIYNHSFQSIKSIKITFLIYSVMLIILSNQWLIIITQISNTLDKNGV